MCSEPAWTLALAWLALAGCSVDIPDLHLESAERALALCDEVVRSPAPFRINFDAPERDSERPACRLTPGPLTRLCRSEKSIEGHWARSGPEPLGVVTIHSTGSQRYESVLVQIEGGVASPAPREVMAITQAKGMKPTAAPDFEALAGRPDYLAGLGWVALGRDPQRHAGPENPLMAFVWDQELRFTSEVVPHTEHSRNVFTDYVEFSTRDALCVVGQRAEGAFLSRHFPDAANGGVAGPFAGTFIPGPRPAFVAPRFDGLLEIREVNDDCTALFPPCVVPPGVAIEPLWDGETLWGTDEIGAAVVLVGSRASGHRVERLTTASAAYDSVSAISLNPVPSPAQRSDRLRLVTFSRPGTVPVRLDLYDDRLTPLGGLDVDKLGVNGSPEVAGVRVEGDRLDMLVKVSHNLVVRGMLYSWGTEIWHIPVSLDCDP